MRAQSIETDGEVFAGLIVDVEFERVDPVFGDRRQRRPRRASAMP